MTVAIVQSETRHYVHGQTEKGRELMTVKSNIFFSSVAVNNRKLTGYKVCDTNNL